MIRRAARKSVLLIVLAALVGRSPAADLVALSPRTWDRYIPQGKEVDGIYGDFALVNEQIMCVIAHPRKGRHANMTVRDVGGCLIDLTRRDRQSDQLSAFYPGARSRDLKFAGIEVEAPSVYEADELDRVFVRARRVTLRLVAAPSEHDVDMEVVLHACRRLALRARHDAILQSRHDARRRRPAGRDSRRRPVRVQLTKIRPICSGPTTATSARPTALRADGHQIVGAKARQLLLRYRDPDGKVSIALAPGASYRLSRSIFPGATSSMSIACRSARRQEANISSSSRSRTSPGNRSPTPTSCCPGEASGNPGAAPTSAGS